MKKIFTFFICVLPMWAISQCSIDTASMSLTAQMRHWYEYIDVLGSPLDSTVQKILRGFKSQAIAQCGLCLDSTTSVTINNVPGRMVEFIYTVMINHLNFGDYMLDGTTDAERRTMFTAIRSSTNQCIQAMVTRIDDARRLEKSAGMKRARSVLIQNN